MILGFIGIFLLAPMVWLGHITSWKIAALPTAVFSLILAYAGIKQRSQVAPGNNPALSLMSKGVVVTRKGAAKNIPYECIKSIEVYAGKGVDHITIRHLENGREASCLIETCGLPVSGEVIKEEVAKRIPTENNPRSGPGILLCSL